MGNESDGNLWLCDLRCVIKPKSKNNLNVNHTQHSQTFGKNPLSLHAPTHLATNPSPTTGASLNHRLTPTVLATANPALIVVPSTVAPYLPS